jgi:hypothetical protein
MNKEKSRIEVFWFSCCKLLKTFSAAANILQAQETALTGKISLFTDGENYIHLAAGGILK